MNYQYVIRSLETGNGFDKFSSGTRRIYDSIHRSRTFDSTGFIKSLVNNGIHRTFQKLCVINHPTICHRCRKILLVSCSLIRDFLLTNRHSIISLEKPSKFSKRPSILCCELHNSVHNSVLTFEKNGRFSLKDAINFVKLHRFKKIRRVEVMKSLDDGCLKNEIMARL